MSDYVRMLHAFHAGKARGIGSIRGAARKDGFVSPVGDANGKTGTATTYRKTGETCPDTCARLRDGTCFTLGGRVSMVQRRDTADRDAAIRAFVVGLATGRMVRVHGSGDFAMVDSRGRKVVDHAYVHGIAEVAAAYREITGRRWVAWTYTHLPGGAWVDLLRESGVAVRLSDRGGAWGSIVVADWADVPRDAFRCPEQTHGIACHACGACWNATGKAVAFKAMGAREKKLATILRIPVK